MPCPRLLLVDDTPLDLELTSLALSDQGLNLAVQVATGGQDALDYLEGLRPEDLPELILLDLKMPGLDGLAVLQQVKQHPLWQRIRVVMLTTSAEARDRDACLQAGANAFVQKSSTLGAYGLALREITRTWLDTVSTRPQDGSEGQRSTVQVQRPLPHPPQATPTPGEGT